MLYYQLVPTDESVSIPARLGAYKCVILIERPVSNELRSEVSRLLVDSGCRYTMAWGLDCGAWDDSVDWAVLEKFNFGEIPSDQFVMTTWHKNDTLEEVFRFAKFDAVTYATLKPLDNLLVLDFADRDRAETVDRLFAEAS